MRHPGQARRSLQSSSSCEITLAVRVAAGELTSPAERLRRLARGPKGVSATWLSMSTISRAEGRSAGSASMHAAMRSATASLHSDGTLQAAGVPACFRAWQRRRPCHSAWPPYLGTLSKMIPHLGGLLGPGRLIALVVLAAAWQAALQVRPGSGGALDGPQTPAGRGLPRDQLPQDDPQAEDVHLCSRDADV